MLEGLAFLSLLVYLEARSLTYADGEGSLDNVKPLPLTQSIVSFDSRDKQLGKYLKLG